jgi:ribonuclease P protein component
LPLHSATPSPSGILPRLAGLMPGPGASDPFPLVTDSPSGSCRLPITLGHSERLHARHRLTAGADYAVLKAEGRAFRGAHCLLVIRAAPGEVTRVGFVASKRGVGGAVQRNRARRRLREIVRRRWPRVPQTGFLMMFVAYRSVPTVAHQDLASDVERVLAAAGALAPLSPRVGGE